MFGPEILISSRGIDAFKTRVSPEIVGVLLDSTCKFTLFSRSVASYGRCGNMIYALSEALSCALSLRNRLCGGSIRHR